MKPLSDLADIVARYREYDPATGGMTSARTHQDYADLLGVSRVFITQIVNGTREPGVDMLRSLSRLFAPAADEIAAALAYAPEREIEAVAS